ncbi:MAG: phospholipase A [Desulfuromonadaceae bacterium]|nr:phospholipase A [Desulfuromonadaceae bacterium]
MVSKNLRYFSLVKVYCTQEINLLSFLLRKLGATFSHSAYRETSILKPPSDGLQNGSNFHGLIQGLFTMSKVQKSKCSLPVPRYLRVGSILALILLVGGVLSVPVCAETQNAKKRHQLIEERVFRNYRETPFSMHKLNYAVIGNNDLKLQYSFKYRFFTKADLYGSFTNLILWDIYEDQNPAYDNNYQPELFYRFVKENKLFLSADVGYWHLSNGTSGEDARSWDRLFVRLQQITKIFDTDLYWTAHIWPITLYEGRENRDINNYLGWWDFGFRLKNILKHQSGDGLDFQFNFRSGNHGIPFDKGNATVGLQYRIQRWTTFNPTLYLQYFTGYGEVIRDYNVRSDELRVGISWFY